MNIAEIIATVNRLIAEGTPREDVYAWLDGLALNRPELAGAVGTVRAMLAPLLDQGNVTTTLALGVLEVLDLWKNKYGPVSDAPEIGLA